MNLKSEFWPIYCMLFVLGDTGLCLNI